MYDDNIKDYKDLKKVIASMHREVKSSRSPVLEETSLNKISPLNYIISNIRLGSILIFLGNFLFSKISLFNIAKFILIILKRSRFIFQTISLAVAIFSFIKLKKCLGHKKL